MPDLKENIIAFIIISIIALTALFIFPATEYHERDGQVCEFKKGWFQMSLLIKTKCYPLN